MLYGHAGYSINRPGKNDQGSTVVPRDRNQPGPDLSAGTTFGAGASYMIFNHLLLGGEVNYMNGARTGLRGLFTPAVEAGVSVKGAFSLGSNIFITGGIVAGPILMFGSNPSDPQAPTYSGMGFSYQAVVSADYFISDRISLGLDAGYQMATISTITGRDGAVLKSLSSPNQNERADYSGPLIRIGIRFYF
jgi:hypothetical protein